MIRVRDLLGTGLVSRVEFQRVTGKDNLSAKDLKDIANQPVVKCTTQGLRPRPFEGHSALVTADHASLELMDEMVNYHRRLAKGHADSGEYWEEKRTRFLRDELTRRRDEKLHLPPR